MQRSFAALCVCLIQPVHAEHVDRALLQDGIDGEVIAVGRDVFAPDSVISMATIAHFV